MNSIEIKRPKLELNEETNELEVVGEEDFLKLTPDEGKCFMNKRTQHKFIHTIKHTGLELTVRPEDIELYEEVSL